MAKVDLYVQNNMWTVGQDWFLHSFFSTIAYRLEPNGWGSRFPALMKELYTGQLSPERVPKAQDELATVRTELSKRPPDERVYAYEDPERPTPWPVPPGAKSLADCFLTSSANNLLDTIGRVLEFSLEANANVEIRPFEQPGKVNVFVTGKEG
jgi:2,3-bisphosphoglycerate-dependent phosphoglycerate mutase